MGRQLASVVDGLLEPLVEDRLTAADALDMLSEQPRTSSSDTAVVRDRQVCLRSCFQSSPQACCTVLLD